jgi:hypothetical protein
MLNVPIYIRSSRSLRKLAAPPRSAHLSESRAGKAKSRFQAAKGEETVEVLVARDRKGINAFYLSCIKIRKVDL